MICNPIPDSVPCHIAMEDQSNAGGCNFVEGPASEVPLYEGDPYELYSFLNMCTSYMLLNGVTRMSTAKLLSRLRGKAQRVVCILNHQYDWSIIKAT